VYPYLVYPALLYILPKEKSAQKTNSSPATLPTVTLIISAYNEDQVIRAKLENALATNYPSNNLGVIVVSDASSDRTDDIVREFMAAEPRVTLVRQAQRRGKSAGLNLAVAESRADVIVFSDANAIYDEDAIGNLVSSFADERVGYVVGAALYNEGGDSRAAESEGLYWKLEIALKRMESRFFSVVGGDGAIYAARRDLLTPLLDDDISDFVTPLQIIGKGYQGRFNDAAHCYESAGDSFAKEFGRKRRIVNRSWRAYRRYASLLRPSAHGKFIFMLLSHKVLRWFAFPLIALAWLCNGLLLTKGVLYLGTWAVISASILLAVFGAYEDRHGRKQSRLVAFCYYFYLVNLAAALGVWDEWRGVRHVTWDHIRKPRS
jgi:cellulose synthase/poly-beta-1,6-N-acetylglucosamine synthase-like glycosyltransferase